ncbi:2-oxoacid:acceptor oxidoreductase subunit alpha [bacterium]|nr:2-oxoacid:acceptor oxidoreductase subunit alpha [bacterium]
MKETNLAVLTGSHDLTGSQACAEGGLSAGCRFLGYYPIFPSFDIVERFAERFSDVKGVLIQMEDEISALAAVLGASWTGKKAMTVTSGPGFAQMAEHIGLGVMLETPCVIVDVQRDGTSEGSPSAPGGGDIMMARWGSHGDYEVIALSPNSPQEMFDMTVKAFSLSEKYRTPVILITDTYVSNLNEAVHIPDAKDIQIHTRKYYKGKREDYLPFQYDAKDLVPPMVDVGKGYRFHVTGLTHDERGYPVMDEKCQEWNVHRLVQKIRIFAEDIVDFEEEQTDDADVIVVSYGAVSRDVIHAVHQVREEGIRAGSLRIKTIWPFPEKKITQLAKKATHLIVPENNFGQICLEVERCARGRAETHYLYHASSRIGQSDDIVKLIKKVMKK